MSLVPASERDRNSGQLALNASANQLRELVAELPVPMAFADEAGTVTVLNREFERLFGYRAADIPTLDVWWNRAFPDPEYRTQVRASWAAALSATVGHENRLQTVEYAITCLDGQVRQVEVTGRLMNGGVLATFTDVTERRASERRVEEAQRDTARLLREAEQSRRALLSLVEDQKETEAALQLHGAALQATAAAVVITDQDGRIEWANPAFTALSGWTLAEVRGRNPREILKSGQHDEHFYRTMWETLKAGKVWRGEIINRRKNGSEVVEDMIITPLRNPQGHISHFIAVKQDMTEQKALQQHFLHGQRMEAIGTLASGIAHDLNNILTPILMVSSILRGRVQDPEERDLFALAESSAKRGADIVQQLLSFSRSKGGTRALVQARHLLKEIGKIIRETFPREITLQERIGRDLWPVSADATQLHQVLLNLCVNARDAMPDGGTLTLTAGNITLEESHPGMPLNTAPGPYLRLEVADTGTGLRPEIRHRIFDPFFTTKDIGKGTGLGLSTALGIVQSHGGFIQVDSTVGKGSTFKVYLPARTDSLFPPEAATELPAPPVAAAAPDPRTILLVDDERTVRDAARVVLENARYRVLDAANGEDALGLFLQHRAEISLVITDLMMPVMNGLALSRALRAIDSKLAIVCASGLAEEEKRLELARLGVTDLLMKPFSGAALLARVRQELAESQK